MDMEFIGMIFKTIFALALVLLLLYLSLKLGGEKLQKFQKWKIYKSFRKGSIIKGKFCMRS